MGRWGTPRATPYIRSLIADQIAMHVMCFPQACWQLSCWLSHTRSLCPLWLREDAYVQCIKFWQKITHRDSRSQRDCEGVLQERKWLSPMDTINKFGTWFRYLAIFKALFAPQWVAVLVLEYSVLWFSGFIPPTCGGYFSDPCVSPTLPRLSFSLFKPFPGTTTRAALLPWDKF